MAFVDLAKTRASAAFVRKALQTFGLPSDIGEAIAALARTIRDDKHLERLLSDIPIDMKREFYESVRPHLRFPARALDEYVAGAGQMAEREQLPTIGPDGQLKPFTSAIDLATAQKLVDDAIADKHLVLTCKKCSRTESFPQLGKETPLDVILKARAAGWIYDYRAAVPFEVCPKCPTSLRLVH